MRRRTKLLSTLSLFTLCALLFVLGFSSYAWFSNLRLSGDIGFTSGEMDDNLLHIAKVVHPSDNTVEISESLRSYKLCENMQIEHDSLPTQNGDAYTVSIEQMSFGIIDNVALLKPDNVVYLRLSVPKTNGNSVKLKLSYNVGEDGYFADMYENVYADDGETVTEQRKITPTDTLTDGTMILDSFHSVEGESGANDCFLRYSLLLSNEDIPATELHNMTFIGSDGTAADDSKGNYYKFNGTDAPILLKNDDVASAGDYYYVYMKIEPNLGVFGYSIEYISEVMPCYVYFRMQAYFEIYQGA